MGRLDKKVALVTGAARGIGAAAAKILAREGASVVCTDVIEDEGEAIASAIQDAGGTAIFLHHDVTDEARWEAVIEATEKKFGGLHVLVNNAGVAPAGGPIDEIALDDWRRTIAIDLDSVFLGCKHGIRAMKRSGGGSIINVSSILGKVGFTNSADYVAAKGGVKLLTKAAALDCAAAQSNIRVNSIHPGFIDTPLVRGAVQRGVEQGTFGSPNEMIDMLVLAHPIGRLGAAPDIGNAILFLASEESAFMTGAELVVDGGYTAR